MARIISCGDPRGMLQCSFCLKNFRLGSQWVAQAGNLWCWKCLNASKLKNNGFYSKPNPKFLFKTLHCIRCKTAFKHKSTLHSSACAPFCKVCFKHNEISYKLKCADDSSRKTEINCEGINQAHAQTICKGLKTHDRILLKNVSINKDEQVLDNSIHVCQSNNWYRKPYYDKDLVDFNKLKLVHKVNGSSLVNCNDTSHVPLHDKQGLNTFTGDLSASSDHQVYGGRVDKVPTSHITALCGNDVNENVNLKHNGMAHHSAGTTNFNFIQNNDFSHVQLICTFCNKKFSSSDGFCVMSGDIKCHSCIGGGEHNGCSYINNVLSINVRPSVAGVVAGSTSITSDTMYGSTDEPLIYTNIFGGRRDNIRPSKYFQCSNCRKYLHCKYGFIAFEKKIHCHNCVNTSAHYTLGSLRCDLCASHINVNHAFISHHGQLNCFVCHIHKDYNLCHGSQDAATIAYQSHDNLSEIKCCCRNPDCVFDCQTPLTSHQCSCPSPTCDFDMGKEVPKHTIGFIAHGPLQQLGSAYKVLKPFNYIQAPLLQGPNIPNCVSPRVVVPTKLNLPLFQHLLSNYWDHQLLSFLHCGFPLDISPGASISTGPIVNHSSASQFSSHIEHYLNTEAEHGAVIGPFVTTPIPNLHSSPMLTRPKDGSTKRRVIVDLSWPHKSSVNDAVKTDSYMGTPFTLRFPTVDDIAARIISFRGRCLLYKVDLQRAFRQLKIDPKDIRFTGLYHNQQHFIDVAVPFGYRHGSMACQRFTDSIRYIMHKHGFTIFNYIDDLIGCEAPAVANRSYQFLLHLLHSLGMPISVEKLFPPQEEVPCLGIDINTVKGTMCIPPLKLATIHTQCIQWSLKSTATKTQLQSLLGTLLYIHKCVQPARIFVNRMLFLLRLAPNNKPITLTSSFHRDLSWFIKFLYQFNGKVIFDKTRAKPANQVYLDACLTGMGGCFGSLVYHHKLPPHLVLDEDIHITQLEMLNVLLALRLWAPKLAHSSLLIHCDNLAVVIVCQSGRTHDPFLAAVVRNIWFVVATYDIQVTYSHIPGKFNVAADLLSRWHLPTISRHRLLELIPDPQWQLISPHFCLVDYSL